MKKAKKIIALICVMALFTGVLSTVGYAVNDVDYTIINPYANVDWSWEQYKTDLHSHTTASDGSSTLKEMIETNYDYGFDIYSVTDHGITSQSWTEIQVIPELKFFVDFRKPGTELVSLDQTGVTFNGEAYTVAKEGNDEYYYHDDTADHKMLNVPFGNEQNPTSLNNSHVNTWFVEYGNGRLGGTSDYETPISEVDALGGLSVINHPGEYTEARYAANKEEAYNEDYEYYIDKFESLLLEYDSCLGIDMNSKGDGRTRHDRKLWDILLKDLSPSGRLVKGIATSDAHSTEAAYTGYTRMILPELTSEALKSAMQNGEFFAASRCLGCYEELTEYANYLLENGSDEAKAAMQDVLDRQVEDRNAKYEADYVTEAPWVNSIDVNDDADTIKLNVTGDWCVRWIANGKTIAWGDEIDLDDYTGKIGSYVRAEILGEGGITYTQAFMLQYDGAPEPEDKSSFTDLWMLASFIPDTIVRFLQEITLFKYLWEEFKELGIY